MKTKEEKLAEVVILTLIGRAALPIGFPPEFIDGNMYVDGGVRMHVFLSRQLEAALQSEPLDISIVVSGDMKVARESGAGRDGLDLLSVAARTASIATASNACPRLNLG